MKQSCLKKAKNHDFAGAFCPYKLVDLVSCRGRKPRGKQLFLLEFAQKIPIFYIGAPLLSLLFPAPLLLALLLVRSSNLRHIPPFCLFLCSRKKGGGADAWNRRESLVKNLKTSEKLVLLLHFSGKLFGNQAGFMVDCGEVEEELQFYLVYVAQKT